MIEDIVGNPVPYGAYPDVGAYEWQGPATSVPWPAASGSAVELNAWPNPCNPQATFAFELAAQLPVSLCVFDARGCMVSELLCETLAAGRHAVRWSGRDAAGRPVASGIYLGRLTVAGNSAVKRLVVVR